MNALTFLSNQHREIEILFAQVEEMGDSRAKDRKSLYGLLALNIEHHARIEETVFYPQGKKADELQTMKSIEMHDVVRFMARKIIKIRPNDKSFLAKFLVLKNLVAQHVGIEEKEYFPRCAQTLGEDVLLQLGAELMEKYAKLQSSVTSKRSAKKAVTR